MTAGNRVMAGVALPLALALALAAGCGSRPDWLTERQALVGPVALTTRLVWTDSNRGEVLSVNPAADTEAGEARVRRIALDEAPTAVQQVPGADAASPPRGIALLTPDSHELHLILEKDGGGALTHRRVELLQGYDQLAFSPDGLHGIAWMGDARVQRDLISVVSKVAIIDVEALLAGQDDAIREPELNLEQAPDKIEFSGSLPLFPGEAPVRLAAVISSARVSLIDLTRPRLRARTIFLDPGVDPDRVRFSNGVAPQAGSEFLLFSSADSGASDRGISTYRILPEDDVAAAEAAGEPRIRLTYDLLLPDDPPSAFEVFPDPSGLRILVVSVGHQAQRATVFELLSSSIGKTVTFPDSARASEIIRAPKPGAELAVLYEATGEGGGQRRLIYLDIDAASQGRPEAELGEAFAERVRRVTPVPQRPGRVLVELHDSSQLELVDVTGDTARSTSIRLQSREVPQWDRRGGAFYVASEVGGLLGRVSLDEAGGLTSTTMALDAPPVGVHLLDGAGLIVVDHGLPQGALTVVPANSLKRESARLLDGLFLDGLVDRAAGREKP